MGHCNYRGAAEAAHASCSSPTDSWTQLSPIQEQQPNVQQDPLHGETMAESHRHLVTLPLQR